MSQQIYERVPFVPFPRAFGSAFVFPAKLETRLTSTPFTRDWENCWREIAEASGTSKALEKFYAVDGLYAPETLAKKGALPNFVMTLLVNYLWRDDVARNERDAFIKTWEEFHPAVCAVQRYYEYCYKSPWMQGFPKWFLDGMGGPPNQEVEQWLQNARNKIERFLGSMDFRDSSKPNPPNEKVNRVIFAIYQHIKIRTNSKHWELLWDLLSKAGAISGGGETSSKDGQIRPHLKSFKNDHPKEANALKDPRLHSTPWFTNISRPDLDP